jgi:hypothetical protein
VEAFFALKRKINPEMVALFGTYYSNIGEVLLKESILW